MAAEKLKASHEWSGRVVESYENLKNLKLHADQSTDALGFSILDKYIGGKT